MFYSIKAYKRHLFLFLVTFWFNAQLAAAVQNSIVPLLDQHRLIKTIEAKKYSQNQYKAIATALEKKEQIIRLVTYQMLFDRYDALLPGHLRWQERLPRIIELIKEMQADIICSQQLYPKQINDLLAAVGDIYGFIGNLPQPNEEPCEVNGIFYRKARFQCKEAKACSPIDPYPELIEFGTFTEAHLLDQSTGKELAIISTHASFGSADSREYLAHFLIDHIEPLSKQKAVILAGDFNTFMPRVDDPHLPYYDGNYIIKILTSKNLRNARDTALIGTLGPLATYTNCEGSLLPFQGTGTPGVFLDHIFVGGNLLVLLEAVQPALVDGLFASDHMPVIVDCINLQ